MVKLPLNLLTQGAIADFTGNRQQVQENFELKEKSKQLLEIAQTMVERAILKFK